MSFERWKNAIRNPRALLDAAGLYLVGKAQAAFREQGRGGASWRERAVPNRAGVLADLQQGRTPPERRWDARPAGIDTGRLRASIAYRVEGARVVVGSALPYASDVQRGSTKTFQIAGALRSELGAWLVSLTGDRRRRAGAAFGPLFRIGSYTVTTPPRPFVVLTPEDRRKLVDVARAFYARGGAA